MIPIDGTNLAETLGRRIADLERQLEHERGLAESATALYGAAKAERDELRDRVTEVERIAGKLQHDVAEAAGMNTLGEEAACTELVVEAVRGLRAKVDRYERALRKIAKRWNHTGASTIATEALSDD